MSAQEDSKNAEVNSTEESVLKTEVSDDGVNKNAMHCLRCSSKILLQNHGTLKEIQFDLPSMRKKQDAAAASEIDLETVKHFWLVPTMFTFENVGFTHTVGDIKYLACADCDVGPIGWSDTKSQQSYVALNRVRYIP